MLHVVSFVVILLPLTRLHCCILKVALFRVTFLVVSMLRIVLLHVARKIVACFTVQCCMVALQVFSNSSIYYTFSKSMY